MFQTKEAFEHPLRTKKANWICLFFSRSFLVVAAKLFPRKWCENNITWCDLGISRTRTGNFSKCAMVLANFKFEFRSKNVSTHRAMWHPKTKCESCINKAHFKFISLNMHVLFRTHTIMFFIFGITFQPIFRLNQKLLKIHPHTRPINAKYSTIPQSCFLFPTSTSPNLYANAKKADRFKVMSTVWNHRHC